MRNQKLPMLSGNALKLIAAAAMVIDHTALLFFPGNQLLRIIGRLALPIFAFMIAQGCRYTRSRLRYFLQLLILAAGCQIVYFVAEGSLYMSVLVTFSCSVPVICALQNCKRNRDGGSMLLFAGAVGLVWLLNRWLQIDYGFWGCMLPVFSSVFQERRGEETPLAPLDKPWIHVAMTGLGLLLLAWDLGGIQIWSLAALPLLLLYSGKRGKGNMKYFFYIFYPVHLAVLQGAAWILLG